jgi:hypothetical protein
MTALITSNIYSNYTADFSFLKGAISRFKPNKIVSSYSPTNTDINFLRNRVPKAVAPPIAPTKTKKKLGERLMGMLPQKKATPKPYSLRSAQLDTAEGRKIISTANQSLKQSPNVTRYSWQKPLQSIENTNQTKTSRIYNSRAEATLNSSAKAQARKAVRENPLRTLSGKDRVNQTLQTKAEAKRIVKDNPLRTLSGQNRVNQTLKNKEEAKKIVKNNPVQVWSKNKRQNYLRQLSLNPYYPISQ